LLEIVDEAPLMASGHEKPLPAGGIWVARAGRRRAVAARAA